MSAAVLLRDLEAAGVRLSLAGDGLRVQTRAGVHIAPYRQRITAHKPALLKELVQREILEAAAAVGDAFDRDAYDQLWRRWYALRDEERVEATNDVPASSRGVEPSVPPAGWDGTLCAECHWPALCGVLGPRGPHLPGGPCPAWPKIGRASCRERV